MVEQLICNQQVVGSTPIGGSKAFMAGIAYNENNPPQVDQRIMQTCKKAPNPVRFVSRSQSEKTGQKDGQPAHYSNVSQDRTKGKYNVDDNTEIPVRIRIKMPS